MPMKEWFRQLQPVQLYIVLILTIVFFIIELIVSHLTHALTLLMDSYHMLCNILALTGCLITIKYSKQANPNESLTDLACENSSEELKTKNEPSKEATQKQKDYKMKNTFGWARIDVISMLICFVFLASFCFSIFVEALQTLVHIDHQDEMHHPKSVLCIGSAGLLLNGICYLLIGGYTFHQGSFLYVTESGDVVLNKVTVSESMRTGERRLSRTKNFTPSPPRQRQGLWEMCRDVLGCIFVIVCSVIILLDTEKTVAKYVDPIMSLASAGSLLLLSYPYMKESCLILLQTIPDTINIESVKSELIKQFPDIVNVHDFHIWQLTATKIISTVHIIFQNPKDYHRIMKDVNEFFVDNGITQVTIQPEFFTKNCSFESLNSSKESKDGHLCLMACQGEECKLNHCCPKYIETLKKTHNDKKNKKAKLRNVKGLTDSAPSSLNLTPSISVELSKKMQSKSESNLTLPV